MAPLRLDPRSRVATRGDRRVQLTVREFRLLEALAEAGRTLSPAELLVRVWGTSLAQGTEVVDRYVDRLQRRLGDDVIERVPGIGYRAGTAAPNS